MYINTWILFFSLFSSSLYVHVVYREMWGCEKKMGYAIYTKWRMNIGKCCWNTNCCVFQQLNENVFMSSCFYSWHYLDFSYNWCLSYMIWLGCAGEYVRKWFSSFWWISFSSSVGKSIIEMNGIKHMKTIADERCLKLITGCEGVNAKSLLCHSVNRTRL